MKSILKKILFRWDLTHRIANQIYDLTLATRFLFEWKIFGKRKTLVMRSSKDLREGLQNLICDLPDNITMVEIGSYKGESARSFLSSGKVRRIFCVDPWKPFYDNTDAASFTDMAKVEAEFDSQFSGDKRVSKEKGTIDDFVRRYETIPQIDFVYIDGCHTEDATTHDIQVTMEHLHPKFAIAGHDYAIVGVKNAVEALLTHPDKIYVDTSWIKFL